MPDINHRKRAAHGRRVQAVLQQILNDPTVMPNADCPDLVVSVSRVGFGRTVREVYVDAFGEWRQSRDQWAESPHDKYVREAEANGDSSYIDLTDVFFFPNLTEIVARELQRRLGLRYTPVIRRFWDLDDGKGTSVMANGNPGDHPLTDIFIHGLEVYGKEIDDLIRRIGTLASKRELNEWWEKEVGWNTDQPDLLAKVQRKYEELLKRAKESGWEMGE